MRACPIPRRRGPITLGFADQFEVDPYRARTGGIGAGKGSRKMDVGVVEPTVEHGGGARGERGLCRFHHVCHAQDCRVGPHRVRVFARERGCRRIARHNKRYRLDSDQQCDDGQRRRVEQKPPSQPAPDRCACHHVKSRRAIRLRRNSRAEK